MAALAVLGLSGCSPTTSTTGIPYHSPPPSALHAKTLADIAVDLAHEDGRAPRKSTYLRPLQRLRRVCVDPAPPAVAQAVESLALVVTGDRLPVAAPRAASVAVLAADAHRRTDCASLARTLGSEVTVARPSATGGWGGYAGELTAWRRDHRSDKARPGDYHPRRANGVDAYQVFSTSGRVYSMVERFSPPVTAALALANIEVGLLPGHVHVVYALTESTDCQQAIYMGPALGHEFGNSSLGAFVELSSGKGVGRTPYDANRVNRARITPLGRIGGQPCT